VNVKEIIYDINVIYSGLRLAMGYVLSEIMKLWIPLPNSAFVRSPRYLTLFPIITFGHRAFWADWLIG
jgi:hypothetical protein